MAVFFFLIGLELKRELLDGKLKNPRDVVLPGMAAAVQAATVIAFALGNLALVGANWAHIYGVACLAGIGFTRSLFIGSLSFEDTNMMNAVRLGVLSGPAVSALLGYTALRPSTRRVVARAVPVAS